MAPPSSPSTFTCKNLFAITLIIVFLLSCCTRSPRVQALKAPIRPQDILPLLPRQVSWPILNTFRGAADLLPSFVGAAAIANNSLLHWKGSCFYENTAWLELHNKSGSEFGGGTLHIKVYSLFILYELLIAFDLDNS